tara:strand:- start:10233 stop:10565 length:333 start_codon:yes stop_codon:yes gene_type:complete
MILLIMLSGCTATGKRPYIKPVERCGYSVEFNKCRCISYDLYNAKKASEGYNRPPEYCDDIVGFRAKDWLEGITPWARENIRMYENSTMTKKKTRWRKYNKKDKEFLFVR